MGGGGAGRVEWGSKVQRGGGGSQQWALTALEVNLTDDETRRTSGEG